MSKRSRDLDSQDTITARRPPGPDKQERGRGSHLICRSHTLVGSVGVGWRRSCWGPRTRCGAWRSDPGAIWRPGCPTHTPNMLAKSSLEECMGTRAASQVKEGRGAVKAEGQGWARWLEGRVAALMGMTMD